MVTKLMTQASRSSVVDRDLYPIVLADKMKQDWSRHGVTAAQPRRSGVGAALRTTFSPANAVVPPEFEVLIAELDARTQCPT